MGDGLITPTTSDLPSSNFNHAHLDAASSGEETPGMELHIKPAAGEAMDVAPTLPHDMIKRSMMSKMDLLSQQGDEKKVASLVGENINASSRRASNVIRSILTCRVVDTNDSVLRPINRRQNERSVSDTGGGGRPLMPLDQNHNHSDHCNSRKSGSMSGRKSSRKAGEKVVPAIYKPTGVPNCSQCRKAFRPEKLHSHMKACKALKVQGKTKINSADRAELRGVSRRQEFSAESEVSAPRLLLTH